MTDTTTPCSCGQARMSARSSVTMEDIVHRVDGPCFVSPHRSWLGVVDALVAVERERAHVKHGDTSMRHSAPLAERRQRILAEEVGEVAAAFNDNDHGDFASDVEFARHLFDELVQVAAMASDWAASIGAAYSEKWGDDGDR